jgi:hypothetical protein
LYRKYTFYTIKTLYLTARASISNYIGKGTWASNAATAAFDLAFKQAIQKIVGGQK